MTQCRLLKVTYFPWNLKIDCRMKQLERIFKYRPIRSIASRLICPFSPLTPDGIFFFHQGRCGSTILANLLGQHPGICSYGEIFEHYMKDRRLPAAPTTMLRERRVRSFRRRALVEAKFFECQHLSLMGLSIEQFAELAKNAGFKKYIVLKSRELPKCNCFYKAGDS